jgi:hypothetical protein
MAGCHRHFGSPVKHKQPLSKSDLKVVIEKLGMSQSHDERLFLAILLTGSHGLMHLEELCFPDRIASVNYRKVSLCHTVSANELHYSFFLPGHKGDRFYEGNTIIIQNTNAITNPYPHFNLYLASHDCLHPFQPELWLREDGEVPTCGWFMRKLREFFPKDIGGQSMYARGATSLAEAGVAPPVIHAIGRWGSNFFQIYI